jgi:hypothetical protein
MYQWWLGIYWCMALVKDSRNIALTKPVNTHPNGIKLGRQIRLNFSTIHVILGTPGKDPQACLHCCRLAMYICALHVERKRTFDKPGGLSQVCPHCSRLEMFICALHIEKKRTFDRPGRFSQVRQRAHRWPMSNEVPGIEASVHT